MNAVVSLVTDHYIVIGTVCAYVILAAVNALPDPATQKFELYPWLYHTAKSLMNAVPPKYTQKLNG